MQSNDYIKLQVCPVDDGDGGKSSTDAGNLSFIIRDEDHTLGNALRYVIMKNPDVEFCGYTIPHPSESLINFRIQSKVGVDSRVVPAVQIFQQGLQDLRSMCSIVLEKYNQTVENFEKMETS